MRDARDLQTIIEMGQQEVSVATARIGSIMVQATTTGFEMSIDLYGLPHHEACVPMIAIEVAEIEALIVITDLVEPDQDHLRRGADHIGTEVLGWILMMKQDCQSLDALLEVHPTCRSS